MNGESMVSSECYKWYWLSAMTITYVYSSESLTKEAVADSS